MNKQIKQLEKEIEDKKQEFIKLGDKNVSQEIINQSIVIKHDWDVLKAKLSQVKADMKLVDKFVEVLKEELWGWRTKHKQEEIIDKKKKEIFG